MSHSLLREVTIDIGSLGMFTRIGGGGSAAPIVLVHGAVISGRYMVPTAERLATEYAVYVPDLPGFGRSDAPARPLAVPELAGALREWLDAAGLAQVHLVGNSLGAQVVADLAARWPQRIASLTLVGPTVDRAGRTRASQLWRLALDALRERPSLIPLHLMDLVRAGWRFAFSTLDIALADHIETKIPHIAPNVLIVCGRRDPIAPEAWCRWLAKLSPHCRLEVIDGPHALNYSRPEALARCIDGWIRDVAQQGILTRTPASAAYAEQEKRNRG